MSIRKIISCFLLACSVTACSEYRYDYTPPVDAEGKACIRNCSNRRWDCDQNCEYHYRNCASSALAADTINNMTRSESKYINTCDYDRSSCISNCKQLYNECYKSCGGEVHVYEVK